MKEPATDRQKEVLLFFGIDFSPGISKDGAQKEIRRLFADNEKKALWRKLNPRTKNPRTRPKNLDDDEMPDHLKSDELYNNPLPKIKFAVSVFVFTGKFSFGEKKECRQAVIEKGGKVEDIVKTNSDYLIVGEKGNPAWKRGNYGVKIGKAINFRRNHGKPAIVSESDWKAALGGENETPKV